jgi:predicted nucleotide-binding protein
VASLRVSIDKAAQVLVLQRKRGDELIESAEFVHGDDGYDNWKLERKLWIDVSKEALRSVYEGDAEAMEFNSSGLTDYVIVTGLEWSEYLRDEVELTRRAVNTLTSLIQRLEYATPASAAPIEMPEPAVDPNAPIFVVHGHDRANLHEIVRVIEGATGRKAVVLHEESNDGRTIIEKFEHHAASAAYAAVLLTGDDEGGEASKAERQPRGRQNVIFELGFFFGKLGRQRVAVLLEPGVERPSDIDGLVYVELDGAGAWKYKLAAEMASAGLQVDYSRIPR